MLSAVDSSVRAARVVKVSAFDGPGSMLDGLRSEPPVVVHHVVDGKRPIGGVGRDVGDEVNGEAFGHGAGPMRSADALEGTLLAARRRGRAGIRRDDDETGATSLVR